MGVRRLMEDVDADVLDWGVRVLITLLSFRLLAAVVFRYYVFFERLKE